MTTPQTHILVTDTNGFVGHHVVSYLKKNDYWVRGVDRIKSDDVTKQQRIRSRNRHNTTLNKVLNWAPQVSLEEGLEKTYYWIHNELIKEGRLVESA